MTISPRSWHGLFCTLVGSLLLCALSGPARSATIPVVPSEVPVEALHAIEKFLPAPPTEPPIIDRTDAGDQAQYRVRFQTGDDWDVVTVAATGALVERRREKDIQIVQRGQTLQTSGTALPDAVRATILRELRGLKIESVRHVTVETGAGRTVRYDVDGDDDYHPIDMIVAPDGTLVRKGVVLRLHRIPKAIAKTIRAAAGPARIEQVKRVSEGARRTFEVECGTRSHMIDLKIGADGGLIEKREQKKPMPADEATSPWYPDAPVPSGAWPEAVPPPRVIPPGETFVIAAAGDIAEARRRPDLTARLLLGLKERKQLAAILTLGDMQYPDGEYRDYLIDYDPTWGQPALKALTRPAPGNHEYYASGKTAAAGYFDYFNGPGKRHGLAGDRRKGYYSFEMGDWHFIALNTSDECGRQVSCRKGSPMHTWLLQDLRRNRKPCVLAYYHHPRFQQGAGHGDTKSVAPLWDALYDAGVELVLAGHEHNFQQLAPLDKSGSIDREHGIRSFVVGTGGADAYDMWSTTREHVLEKHVRHRIGVLELTLAPRSYGWRFLGADGTSQGEPLAEGKDVCH